METDDYQILDLDQHWPKQSDAPKSPPPRAFEDFDFDDGEPIDYAFNQPLVDEGGLDEEISEKDDINNIVENYEENEYFSDSDDEASKRPVPKFVIPKRTNKRQPMSKLDDELKNVLAHARILKAEKKYTEAIKTCQGLIKLAPTADEIYSLLASLYELTGNFKEAQQIKEVAEIIAPSSREAIEQKLSVALEAENYLVASFLYGKLSRMDLNNLKLHQEYIKTLKHIGAEKRILFAQCHMIKGMKEPGLAEEAKELAVATAFQLMKFDRPSKAKSCLENLVSVHPDLADESFLNLLTEIYVKLEDYEAIMLCLIVKCDVKAIDSEGTEVEKVEDFKLIVDCEVPEDMAVELKSKLAIALVGLGHPQLSAPLEALLLQFKDYNADPVIDIASTHKKKGSYFRAIELLDEIISMEEHDTAENWGLFAECFEESSQFDKAVCSYQTAIMRNPEKFTIRLQLSKLLEKMGNIRGAIDALQPDPSSKKIDTDTQYELCLLCERHMNLPTPEGEVSFVEDFIKSVQTLFLRHSHTIRNRNEFEGFFSTSRTVYTETKIISEFGFRPAKDFTFTTPSHKVADEYRLFEKVYECLLSQKRYPELARFVFQSIMSNLFTRGARYSRQLWAKALVASYFNRDSYALFGRARAFLENHDKTIAWNFYNFALYRCPDFRHSKTLLRFSTKNPDCIPALILTGHNSLLAGSYKYALNEYMSAFKVQPDDPMILLCIGCVFIHLACQKFSDRKSSLILQGMSFLKAYREVRGEGQETSYNIGRAYHQVGLLSQALHHYRLALEQEPWLPSCDIKREIALNIVTIYKQSGARDLALHYLKKYLSY